MRCLKNLIVAFSLGFSVSSSAGEMLNGSDAVQLRGTTSPYGSLETTVTESEAAKSRNWFIESQAKLQGDKPWKPASEVNNLDDFAIDANKVAGTNGGQKEPKNRIALSTLDADTRPVQVLISLSKNRMSIFAPGEKPGTRETITNVKIHSSMDKSDFYYELKHPKKNPKAPVATAIGCYEPWTTDPNHHSRGFGNAPMGHSTFFFDGEAVHEWNKDNDSHGCIHAPPAVATKLYDIIKRNGGTKNVAVCLVK